MKQSFVIIILVVLFASCKSKDNPSPDPAPATTGSTASHYTYGSMDLLYYQYYTGNTFSNNDSAATAVFYSDPLYPATSVQNAGNVSLNSNALPNTSNHYQLFNVNVHTANSIWAVSGSSVVPAINYTFTPNFPLFTGNAQLPDSFSLSSGVNISLSGVSNFGTNSIFVQIHDNLGASVYKTIQPGSFSCSFSSSELASFQASNYATIIVNLGNSNIQTFGGKDYGIGCMLIHQKNGIKIKS